MKRFFRVFVAAAVLFLLHSGLLAQEHIRILHWADFHAANRGFPPSGKQKVWTGGMPLLAGAIQSFRADSVPVAVVHAGDEFQGTPISTLTRGESQVYLLSLLKLDVFEPGNHDFDYGKDRLLELLRRFPLPVICANLFDRREGRLLFPPYRIVSLGSVRVGFIGLITPSLSRLVMRKNVAGLRVLEPAASVRRFVRALRDSVDLFVVVSHMGIDRDRELARQVGALDLILGGHSHTVMRKPEIVNGVLISHAGSKGRSIGIIDLWVDAEKDTIVSFRRRLEPLTDRAFRADPGIQAVVDSLEAVVDRELGEVVATLKRDWVRKYRGESNIGDWIADAYRAFTGADIAFHNSGGIRKGLKKGPVTKRDFWEICPFENRLVVFEVRGRELYRLLETNFDGKGEFLQMSGLEVWVDLSRPPGQRVLKVRVNGEPVKDSRIYRVATNNFLVDHFYDVFGLPPKGRKISYLDAIDHDVLIWYARKQKVIEGKKAGRIHYRRNR
jgi:2',3'-cyclic-nucleotide 2'-phosphodiesterase (5'-nucleotidase family)